MLQFGWSLSSQVLRFLNDGVNVIELLRDGAFLLEEPDTVFTKWSQCLSLS